MSRGGAQSAVASRYERVDTDFPLVRVRIRDATDDQLKAISGEMGIGLSVDELHRVRDYFAAKDRDPTDVELEALGQAWSEHCCYKSSKPVLKKNIYGIAEDKVVSRGDAGTVEFDADHLIVAKMESHNHPSAIEPYGGAGTGVGGILRDVLCVGGQPLALVDPLFFGPPDLPMEKLPQGVKHPSFLFQGVVEGIRDYGNRVGIPTVSGGAWFHPGFTWNCLVNVGCVGIVRKDKRMDNRAKQAGNVYVYAGGSTGRDGIHGVTFASAELGEGSEEGSRSAVQVGDPITKEPLIHAVLECVDRGLLVGMKDFGGGGLSCVAGELAFDAGLGAEVDLEHVPLKEAGMAPWEIWVSESQERMMLVVDPERVDEVLHVFKKWDVFAAQVGRVIEQPIVRARMKGHVVLELDLAFSTGGPVYDRPAQRPPETPTIEDATPLPAPADPTRMLEDMLGRWNICSKEWIVRQYDHVVRANTVLQPLQGKIGTAAHGDAAVLKPVEDSWQGLAVATAANPNHCERDPYWGASGTVDEAVRNLASVGARLVTLCDNLNYGNPEDPVVMGQLYEGTRGLADVARTLDVPYSSGNVSLYNEAPSGPVPPTPALMAIGIVRDLRSAQTSDFKPGQGDVFLVGQATKAELGGSEYAYAVQRPGDGAVPRVDASFTQQAAEALVQAIELGLVAACHDSSDGGAAVCAAEMALGGDVGVTLDLDLVGPDLEPHEAAYSETHTRWLVQVTKGREGELSKHFAEHDVPCKRVGRVGGRTLTLTAKQKTWAQLSLVDARQAWSQPLHKVVAG